VAYLFLDWRIHASTLKVTVTSLFEILTIRMFGKLVVEFQIVYQVVRNGVIIGGVM
jgi:hypothetical protein